MAYKHNVSLIITGVVVALFVMFIILAVFITPTVDTEGISEEMVPIVKNMGQMVWWTTLALVMLPIMLILIVIAGFLFISAAKLTATPPMTTPVALTPAKHGLLGSKPAPAKVNDPSTPYDVLDLRYARGEITRDQYMAMKSDMKANRL